MQKLDDRLNALANSYYLQVPPLVLMLAIGIGSAPVLAWAAGLLLALSTANKAHRMFFRDVRSV